MYTLGGWNLHSNRSETLPSAYQKKTGQNKVTKVISLSRQKRFCVIMDLSRIGIENNTKPARKRVSVIMEFKDQYWERNESDTKTCGVIMFCLLRHHFLRTCQRKWVRQTATWHPRVCALWFCVRPWQLQVPFFFFFRYWRFWLTVDGWHYSRAYIVTTQKLSARFVLDIDLQFHIHFSSMVDLQLHCKLKPTNQQKCTMLLSS